MISWPGRAITMNSTARTTSCQRYQVAISSNASEPIRKNSSSLTVCMRSMV